MASSGKENAQNESLCVLVPDRLTTGGIMEVLCIGRELNISTIFGTMAGSWIVVAVAVSFPVKDSHIFHS